MTTKELHEYIISEVPNFRNPGIIGPGIAYHYTSHAKAIILSNQFLGAPINKDLDKTQNSLKSKPATNDPGAVFAYENIEDAREEGFDCQIIEVHYNSAIKAMHGQESELSSLANNLSKTIGFDIDIGVNEHPHTLIILNTEIENFELIN